MANQNQEKKQGLPYYLVKDVVFVLLVTGITLFFNSKYQDKIAKIEKEKGAYLESVRTESNIKTDSARNENMRIKDSFLNVQRLQNIKEYEQLRNLHERNLAQWNHINNKSLEQLRQQLELQGSLTLADKNLKNELSKISKLDTLAYEAKRNEINLDYISKQLSEFYWPIYYRLEKNNSLYKLMSNTFIGDKIDTSVILKNHVDIADILQKKIYLAESDKTLIEEITKYLRHVAVYQAIKEDRYKGFPEKFGLDYSKNLFEIIKERTDTLQRRYNNLLNRITLSESLSKSLQTKIVSKDTIEQWVRNYYLNHKPEDFTFTIKKAWKKQNFLKTIDDNLTIVFNDFIEENRNCVFIFKYKDGVDKKLKEQRKFLNMKKGEFDWVVINNNNYQIKLEDVYSTQEKELGLLPKTRIWASIRVKKWPDMK